LLFPCATRGENITLSLEEVEQELIVALSSKKRAVIAVLVLLLLLLGVAGIFFLRMHRRMPAADAGNPPVILGLLPPDSPVVLYLDAAALRGLQSSPLAAVLGLTSPSPQQDRDYADFVRDTGFNYERDLDHAAMAAWPAGIATPENPLGDDHVFVVAEGRFDQQKIEAYALRTGHVETRGTQSVYEVPGQPPIAFQFLSADRIVIASGKDADKLLDASDRKPRDSAMQARIDRVAGAPFFAVARMDNLPDSFYWNFRNAPQVDQFVHSIRSLSLAGKPQNDRIQMSLDVECDSMKNALELSSVLQALRMFGNIALADPNTRRQMTKQQYAFSGSFLKEVQISPQDHWIRMTLDITPEMLGTASTPSNEHAPAPSR
jgi:hypothetical protein